MPTYYLPTKESLESILKHHKIEIDLHEKLSGFELGRLEYAISILSDIQEMAKRGEKGISTEVDEVKALILSVIRKKREDRNDEIHDL